METTRKTSFDFDAIAWGVFFLFWAFTALFKSLPAGIGGIGIGLIMISLNVARSLTGHPTSTFTIIFGLRALLLGGLELSRQLLHLSFELPTFAILLFALGLITVVRAMKK